MNERNKTNTFNSLKGIFSLCSFVDSKLKEFFYITLIRNFLLLLPSERKKFALFMFSSIVKVYFSSNGEKKNRKLSFVETQHKGLELLSVRLLAADFQSQSLNREKLFQVLNYFII